MTETTICQQFSKVFSLSQSGRGQKGERGPMGPRVSKKQSNLLWLQLTSSCYAPHNYKQALTLESAVDTCYNQGPPGKSIRGPQGVL